MFTTFRTCASSGTISRIIIPSRVKPLHFKRDQRTLNHMSRFSLSRSAYYRIQTTRISRIFDRVKRISQNLCDNLGRTPRTIFSKFFNFVGFCRFCRFLRKSASHPDFWIIFVFFVRRSFDGFSFFVHVLGEPNNCQKELGGADEIGPTWQVILRHQAVMEHEVMPVGLRDPQPTASCVSRKKEENTWKYIHRRSYSLQTSTKDWPPIVQWEESAIDSSIRKFLMMKHSGEITAKKIISMKRKWILRRTLQKHAI